MLTIEVCICSYWLQLVIICTRLKMDSLTLSNGSHFLVLLVHINKNTVMKVENNVSGVTDNIMAPEIRLSDMAEVKALEESILRSFMHT